MSVKLISADIAFDDSHTLAGYRSRGGFETLKTILTTMKPEEVVEKVKKSSLRGLGGAGFPAGIKWSFVPKDTGKPVYLCVNADEGEPGTFKDRLLLENVPHQLIEGVAIACYAIGSRTAYIYIRGELVKAARILEKAIEESRAANLLGDRIMGTDFTLDVHVHRGAGAYICGEETALIESLEGKKGQPRLKPPFPAVVGVFGCPTIVNNVETLSLVPHVFKVGPEEFAALGHGRSGGTKLYGISGHVNKPGVYELNMGTPLRELIYEHAGGILGGKELKAVIPGGSSTPVLLPEEIDVPMEFDELAKLGSMMGSAATMVIAEGTCMVRLAARLMRFYSHESCGQCTPCREGTGWLYRVLNKIERGEGTAEDVELIGDVCDSIQGHTICPLGDAAAMPIRAFWKKFRSEFDQHVELGRCPMAHPWGYEKAFTLRQGMNNG